MRPAWRSSARWPTSSADLNERTLERERTKLNPVAEPIANDPTVLSLQRDWRDAGLTLGVGLRSRPWISVLGELLERHSEPGRRYHGLDHIAAVLRAIVELTGDLDPDLVLVAFFHDAIYDATRSDNEELSAQLASERLRRIGVSETTVEFVTQTILATSTHQLPDPTALPAGERDVARAGAFLDADLSILGAWDKTYTGYAEAIREEYGHLDEQTFTAGRAKVLRSFLDREQLYFTEAGRVAWEASARRNLQRELTMLDAALLARTSAAEQPGAEAP